MYAEIESYIFIYEDIQGGVRLLRAYGNSPVVTLPCAINNKIITEIGAYCFSSRAKLSETIKKELAERGLGDGEKTAENTVFRPLCGEYLQEITLPNSIEAIEDYAFYGCRGLKQLSIGNALNTVGSDVFMNCKSLHSLILRADVSQKTILQKILSLINTEIEVSFVAVDEKANIDYSICENSLDIDAGICQARVIYPMFTETYELLGPAHIFGLNLEGEGYRARKQFKDDKIDLAGYDQIFYKASHEEGFETLVKMAIDRLLYPVDLSEEAKRAYEIYVSENESKLMKTLVERGAENEMLEILRSGLISPNGKKSAIEASIAAGRTLLVSKICRI